MLLLLLSLPLAQLHGERHAHKLNTSYGCDHEIHSKMRQGLEHDTRT